MIVAEGRLKGVFKGFRNRNTIFEFSEGPRWRQAKYKYRFHIAIMPRARVVERAGAHFLYVEGIEEPIEVRIAPRRKRSSERRLRQSAAASDHPTTIEER
jgi:hypothetical protein